MTKYTIGEIFSSGRATLHKNPSDQTELYFYSICQLYSQRDLGVFEKCLVYFRRPYARYFRENGEKK